MAARRNAPAPEPKSCAACGRTIEWRKKWERSWEQVRYCSDACRRNKPGTIDEQIEATILRLLDGRAAGATICPSDAARALFSGESWRDEMERTRAAARRLVAAGHIVITQQGRVVDPSTARGPIRLRRNRSM